MNIVDRVAARWLRFAGPLTDISKLRFQAVVMMGAGGSGKGYVSHKWLKYMPGGGSSGYTRKNWEKQFGQFLGEEERGLTNINFEKTIDDLKARGVEIELVSGGGARIPFQVYYYDTKGGQRQIPPKDWEEDLPPDIYKEVKGLVDVVFRTPTHALPSYWRQVNPDIYKEELLGYRERLPGYVHEMSSTMSVAYLQAAAETGDPIFLDGTGRNINKMKQKFDVLKGAGYKISLVFVSVPLVVLQIRNATRSRKVSAMIATSMWQRVSANYMALRSLADKSQVIINRNDKTDISNYLKSRAQVDQFISQSYHGEYSGLGHLIQAKSPSEYRQWQSYFGWK